MSDDIVDENLPDVAPASSREERVHEEERWCYTRDDIEEWLHSDIPENDVWSHATSYRYNPHHVFLNLFRFRGTTMPHVLLRPSLWFSIITFSGTMVCRKGWLGVGAKCGDSLPALAPGDLSGTLLPLLTFFLAFYTQECYNRFKTEYINLKRIEGNIRSLGICVRVGFKCPERKLAKYDMLELFRYLCAAYYSMCTVVYGGDNYRLCLEGSHNLGLLSRKEKEALEQIPESVRWYKLLSWAFRHTEQVSHRNLMTEKETCEVHRHIMAIRQEMNTVIHDCEMRVPLGYYHTITFLTVTICLAFSYSVGYSKDIQSDLGILVLMLQLFGFLGMHEVAMQLADPFGDDECDLPVVSYVTKCMAFMTMYVSDDSEEELHLNEKEFAKGSYWVSTYYGDEKEVAWMLSKAESGRNTGLKRVLLKFIMRLFSSKYYMLSHWKRLTSEHQASRKEFKARHKI